MASTKPPKRSAPQCIYELHIELQYIEPRIWRTVLVPDTLTLAKLHRVLQAVMSWDDTHLHAWRIEGQRYGLHNPDWDEPGAVIDERKVTLAQVLGDTVKKLQYSYDFGDGWEHLIKVQKRLAPEADRNTWPMCTGGANATPPEDVGGPPGYLDFVQAMRDPRHQQHQEVWQWWGGPFDPEAFSMNEVNRALRTLR